MKLSNLSKCDKEKGIDIITLNNITHTSFYPGLCATTFFTSNTNWALYFFLLTKFLSRLVITLHLIIMSNSVNLYQFNLFYYVCIASLTTYNYGLINCVVYKRKVSKDQPNVGPCLSSIYYILWFLLLCT